MKMKLTLNRAAMLCALLAGLMAFLLAAEVWAQDNDDHGHGQAHHGGDGGVVEVVSGDGDSSWGIGAGGPGDVDIDDCWGSTQWGGLTIFRQKLVTLETCLGFRFLAIQKYELAAMHFCNDKPTLKEFANEAECEVAHDFTPLNPAPDLGGLYNQAAQFDEHYELAQQQEEEIEYLQKENASIVGRLDDLTARLDQEPAPAPAQKQAPQYSEEQFNAVWAALGIKEDEDDE